MLDSRFAEVAFAMHAQAARDEMKELATDFQKLTAMSSVETPTLDSLIDLIA